MATSEDDKEIKEGLTLDQITEEEQRKLDSEGEDDTKEEQDDKSDDDGDSEEGKDDDSEQSDEDDSADEEESKDDDVQEDDTPASDEVDEDINKPGKGKVEIKSIDGKKFYFNNLDEVPDGFEPVSYKELMRGTKELMRKEDSDFKAEEERVKTEEQRETKKRTDALQKEWDKDIKSLGIKEDKEIEEVYSYMERKLQQGIVVNNFETAYKAVQYDKYEIEKEKELNNRKNARGGSVQGGGTSTSGKSDQKVALPPGLSLDQVHDLAKSRL